MLGNVLSLALPLLTLMACLPARADRQDYPEELTCAARVELSRVSNRRRTPHAKPVNAETATPAQALKWIRSLKRNHVTTDGASLALRWIEYDLDRLPHHPVVPARKTHPTLHKALAKMLEGHTSPQSRISFLAVLRHQDPELLEVALDCADRRKQRRAVKWDGFRARTAVEEWIQSGSPGIPDYHGPHHTLSLTIGAIARGELSDDQTMAFLLALQERSPRLYAAFVDEVAEDARPNAPKRIPNVDRWVTAWDKAYRSYLKERFFPAPTERPELYRSLLAFLGGEVPRPSQRRFFALLRNTRPVLHAYATSWPDLHISAPRTRMPPGVLSAEETVTKWGMFYDSSLHHRPLYILSDEEAPLYLRLKAYLRPSETAKNLREFRNALEETNPVLAEYFKALRPEVLYWHERGHDMSDMRALRWVYEWLEYAERGEGKLPHIDDPVFGRLRVALDLFKRGAASRSQHRLFLDALRGLSAGLYRYATTNFAEP